MTVSLIARHEITKTDSNGNETCFAEKPPSNDHTDSLLTNLSTGNLGKLGEELAKDKRKAYDDKYKRLFSYDDAPEFLKHNVYIRSGYRGILNSKLCMESIFWWTNETINIWSHIFGLLLFVGLTFKDFIYIEMNAPVGDRILAANVLLCFQVCMAMSSMYHTFSCRSENDFNYFLTFDLFGIALSLLAIYMSGIYYAFWCEQQWRRFYMSTVALIFAIAMALQLPKLNVPSHVKTLVFLSWALYGVIPTIHWTIRSGGFESPVVQIFLPRVIGMYLISGSAFLVYITKIPERIFAGKFDYLGHSHQWWHIIVVCALYYWHNSGVIYLEFRMHHACDSGHIL